MFQAVIFDFDGVIADTEWLHSETFRRVLGEEGIHLTDKDHEMRFLGINDRTAFVKAFDEVSRQLTRDDVETLVTRKSGYYRQRLGEVRPFPGVTELLEDLSVRVPVAIASGGRGAEIEAILQANALREHFVAVYSADEIPRSKPAPDLFLAAFNAVKAAASKLGAALRPEDCVAIEDSIHGIHAAKSAGLYCIAVAHTYPEVRLQDADRVLKQIGDLKLQDLLI